MNYTIDWTELINRLAEPFPEDAIRWRPGHTRRNKTQAIALAYADVRSYEDRLNEVCPPRPESQGRSGMSFTYYPPR